MAENAGCGLFSCCRPKKRSVNNGSNAVAITERTASRRLSHQQSHVSNHETPEVPIPPRSHPHRTTGADINTWPLSNSTTLCTWQIKLSDLLNIPPRPSQISHLLSRAESSLLVGTNGSWRLVAVLLPPSTPTSTGSAPQHPGLGITVKVDECHASSFSVFSEVTLHNKDAATSIKRLCKSIYPKSTASLLSSAPYLCELPILHDPINGWLFEDEQLQLTVIVKLVPPGPETYPIVCGSASQSRWTTLGTEGKSPLARTVHSAVVHAVGDQHLQVIIFGGFDGRHCLNDTHIYELHTDSLSKITTGEQSSAQRMLDTVGCWRKVVATGAFPTARKGHTAVMCDNVMLVFGGCGEGQMFFNDIYEFHPGSEAWMAVSVHGSGSHKDKLPKGRYLHSCVLYKRLMYIFGGIGGNSSKSGLLKDLFSFDVDTKCWKTVHCVGTAPTARCAHSAVIHNSSMLVFGGCAARRLHLNDLHELNLDNLIWTSINTQSVAQYIPFKNTKGGSASKQADLYNHEPDLVNTSKPSPRRGHSACVYGNRMLVFGGFNHDGCAWDLYEYNTRNNTWMDVTWKYLTSDASQPIDGRTFQTTILLHNLFVVFGGNTDKMVFNCLHACHLVPLLECVSSSSWNGSATKDRRGPNGNANPDNVVLASIPQSHQQDNHNTPITDGGPSLNTVPISQHGVKGSGVLSTGIQIWIVADNLSSLSLLPNRDSTRCVGTNVYIQLVNVPHNASVADLVNAVKDSCLVETAVQCKSLFYYNFEFICNRTAGGSSSVRATALTGTELISDVLQNNQNSGDCQIRVHVSPPQTSTIKSQWEQRSSGAVRQQQQTTDNSKSANSAPPPPTSPPPPLLLPHLDPTIDQVIEQLASVEYSVHMCTNHYTRAIRAYAALYQHQYEIRKRNIEILTSSSNGGNHATTSGETGVLTTPNQKTRSHNAIMMMASRNSQLEERDKTREEYILMLNTLLYSIQSIPINDLNILCNITEDLMETAHLGNNNNNNNNHYHDTSNKSRHKSKRHHHRSGGTSGAINDSPTPTAAMMKSNNTLNECDIHLNVGSQYGQNNSSSVLLAFTPPPSPEPNNIVGMGVPHDDILTRKHMQGPTTTSTSLVSTSQQPTTITHLVITSIQHCSCYLFEQIRFLMNHIQPFITQQTKVHKEWITYRMNKQSKQLTNHLGDFKSRGSSTEDTNNPDLSRFVRLQAKRKKLCRVLEDCQIKLNRIREDEWEIKQQQSAISTIDDPSFSIMGELGIFDNTTTNGGGSSVGDDLTSHITDKLSLFDNDLNDLDASSALNSYRGNNSILSGESDSSSVSNTSELMERVQSDHHAVMNTLRKVEYKLQEEKTKLIEALPYLPELEVEMCQTGICGNPVQLMSPMKSVQPSMTPADLNMADDLMLTTSKNVTINSQNNNTLHLKPDDSSGVTDQIYDSILTSPAHGNRVFGTMMTNGNLTDVHTPNCTPTNKDNQDSYVTTPTDDHPTGIMQVGVGVPVPSYWSIHGMMGHQVNTHYNILSVPDKKEWISNLMQMTDHCGKLQNLNIVRIERIENVMLWKSYQHQKIRLLDIQKRYGEMPEAVQPGIDAHWQLDYQLNEFYLFHGTGNENVDTISEFGFDERLARSGLYGGGIYFAEKACKAYQYTSAPKPQQRGEDISLEQCRCMLYCRVVLGHAWYTTSNYTGHRPPEKTRKGRLYDSVIANSSIANKGQQVHREFVVYDRDQVYPEYVVYFTAS